MITHNDTLSSLSRKMGIREGELNTEGDIEWMEKVAKQEIGFEQVEEMVD